MALVLELKSPICPLNLLVSGWICESLTVEVHPGEDITLFCSNLSSSPTQTDWFRVINGTKPSCISSMYGPEGEASYCHGFQSEKFNMSSNVTTVFLHIKQVDLMDSGLYFCGFYRKKHTVVGSATELIIKEAADQLMDLMPGILGALTALLSVTVVVLAVKNRRLERASSLKLQKERNKNVDPDDLNYAALSFQAKAKKSHRSGPQREPEPHVVYAATR
uniref:Ig-like domain-containing protein n=1 Tax=Poecilia latipinna TaxID=48699 RepID=A0A3B3TWH1_9TELE